MKRENPNFGTSHSIPIAMMGLLIAIVCLSAFAQQRQPADLRAADRLEPALRESLLPGSRDDVPMPVIIQFRDDVTEPAEYLSAEGPTDSGFDVAYVDRMMRRNTEEVYAAGGIPDKPLRSFRAVPAVVTRSALARLAAHPRVLRVSLDYKVQSTVFDTRGL